MTNFNWAVNPTKLIQSIEAVKARKEDANDENVRKEYEKRGGLVREGREVEETEEAPKAPKAPKEPKAPKA